MTLRRIFPGEIPSKVDDDILAWLDKIEEEMTVIRGMVHVLRPNDDEMGGHK